MKLSIHICVCVMLIVGLVAGSPLVTRSNYRGKRANSQPFTPPPCNSETTLICRHMPQGDFEACMNPRAAQEQIRLGHADAGNCPDPCADCGNNTTTLSIGDLIDVDLTGPEGLRKRAAGGIQAGDDLVSDGNGMFVLESHKVVICHNPEGPSPKTISVSNQALVTHLAHGDIEGVCPDCFCSLDELEDTDMIDMAVKGDIISFNQTGESTWKPHDALHLEGTDSPSWFAHTLEVVGRAIFGSATNSASGSNSLATGSCTTASGDQATAMGYGTTASTDDSLVVGHCNAGIPGALFEVGNGIQGTDCACASNSNAMEVKTNGDTRIGGDLRVDGESELVGNTTFFGQLFGTMLVSDSFEMIGTLNMAGQMVANGGVVVHGGTSLNGTLFVGGVSYFFDDVVANKSLVVVGDLDVQGSCGKCGAPAVRTAAAINTFGPTALSNDTITFNSNPCVGDSRAVAGKCTITSDSAHTGSFSSTGIATAGTHWVCSFMSIGEVLTTISVTAEVTCEVGPLP